MSTGESPLIATGFTLMTACIVGTVSGITVVLGPPVITAAVVTISAAAGEFFAGVFLGTILGLTIAGFTAFLVYRLYRLQQTHNPQVSDGVMYQPTGSPDAYQTQITDGEPPWFDMYLIGTVTALLVSMAFGPWATVFAGVVGALVSAQLFVGA
ncbi:hypothetical protein [Haloarchaeobius sp. DFWS5]|uniref:hypothetical protein n=1 Tax=Haloarchaeobius sp. DFWS5 TaxID=3446114 RepID=UPI003EB9434E